MKEPIDLRICKSGDILISSLGGVLKYIRPTNKDEYLEHLVEFIEPKEFAGFRGTRTHDGYVMRMNRDPEIDHNIVEIQPKK